MTTWKFWLGLVCVLLPWLFSDRGPKLWNKLTWFFRGQLPAFLCTFWHREQRTDARTKHRRKRLERLKQELKNITSDSYLERTHALAQEFLCVSVFLIAFGLFLEALVASSSTATASHYWPHLKNALIVMAWNIFI